MSRPEKLFRLLGQFTVSEQSVEGSGGGDNLRVRRSCDTAMEGGGLQCRLLISLVVEDSRREKRLVKLLVSTSLQSFSFLS